MQSTLSPRIMPPRKLSAIILLVIISGCSAGFVRPSIYPNEHLKKVGSDQFERELTECNDLAAAYVTDRDKYDQLARETATGAAIGSASGALAEVIMGGSVGESVAAGAAVGAIIPLLHQLFRADQPSPNREKFVRICLTDRGYQVL